MQAPPVQYVQTPDDMSIAFTDSGEGPAFVFMPAFLSHMQNLWLSPSAGGLLRELSKRFRLITYDARGQGLSSRNLGPNVTLDDFLLDFETVRDHLGLNRFVLLGSCSTSFLAAHYAYRHPDQVRALVLVNAALSWDAWRLAAIYDELPSQNWELFLWNMVPQSYPAEYAVKMVDYFRDGMSQSDYLASVPAWRGAGLEGLVHNLHTPTLVLHSKDFRLRAVEGPLELARRLPNARLTMMDGFTLFGEPGQAIEAIDEFLGDIEARAQAGHNEGAGNVPRMTEREVEVLRLIAGGATNREIAEKLVISGRTVERHITHIYGKIGARGKADATAFALKHSIA
jgi:pimeloyl-ACP methyl ester carboxylesterase/DNA-binding CsgD family transcriptional regulator